ncbi:PREDICTED: collectrin [Chrysochloris asiatica]|uniref:Collectrin n=1 Tax=Chrysochloris asiatica TaxID=185453 RepID=A0A9B0T2Z2_CHRAS|nr:PREDICTED: collectrin [Chrysochloris asiatica]
MAKAALSGGWIFFPRLPCVFYWERMFWLLFFLVPAIHTQLCQPDGENAFKVRLSIKTALGDKSYVWDTNEEYLFRAMVAFAMRKVPNRETTDISHVLLCNVTKRVSFWFVVTDPLKNHTLPAAEVQSAIRMNRDRINNAFFLNDQTLEFLKIPSTLAPPSDPATPIWIIVFGVIFCIVIVAITLLILSGIRQRRRSNRGPSESLQILLFTQENGVHPIFFSAEASHSYQVLVK